MTDFNIMNKSFLVKGAWVPRLQSSTHASWKIITEAALENNGGLLFLSHCNCDINWLELNNVPLFYRETLKHWQTTKTASEEDTPPQNKIIWNNRNIRITGKPLFYKRWFEKHIVHITDLLQNNGNFIPFAQFAQNFNLKTPFALYSGLTLFGLGGGGGGGKGQKVPALTLNFENYTR